MSFAPASALPIAFPGALLPRIAHVMERWVVEQWAVERWAAAWLVAPGGAATAGAEPHASQPPPRSATSSESAPGHADSGADPGGAPIDPAAAHQLVTANFSFVWRSLRRLGLRDADAEDALQQVFIIATRKLDAIEPGKEQSYLFGIAMRVASKTRRSLGRRREDVSELPPEGIDQGPGADELLDRARARALLDQILEAMPDDLRTVFILFEIEQKPAREIAEMLDIPAGTVASRLRRSREAFLQIRKRFEARRCFEATSERGLQEGEAS